MTMKSRALIEIQLNDRLRKLLNDRVEVLSLELSEDAVAMMLASLRAVDGKTFLFEGTVR